MSTLPLQDLIFPEYCGITHKSRVLKAQFGDSYDQTRAAGINSNYREWHIVYRHLDNDEKKQLESFLRSVGQHTSFSATLTGDSTPSKWKVTSEVTYDVVATIPRIIWIVSFTATEVFA